MAIFIRKPIRNDYPGAPSRKNSSPLQRRIIGFRLEEFQRHLPYLRGRTDRRGKRFKLRPPGRVKFLPTPRNGTSVQPEGPVYAASSRSHGPVIDDNGPREEQSEKALAKLRPVFDREFGTITAGNASHIPSRIGPPQGPARAGFPVRRRRSGSRALAGKELIHRTITTAFGISA